MGDIASGLAALSASVAKLQPKTPEPIRVDVGMDLDGVNYEFDHAYYQAMLVLRPHHPAIAADAASWWREQPYQKAQSWEFYEDLYDQTAAEFVQVCNEAVDAGIIFASDHGRYDMKDGRKAWKDLKRRGHRIHIKTARSFGTHPAASETATRTWLREGSWPHDSLTFTHDKTVGPAVDMMLEDNLDNYDALDAAGVEVWLFDQPWNRDNGKRRRVFTHEEFVRRVDAFCVRKQEAADRQAAMDRHPAGKGRVAA